eukprot:jgi/Bigna1/37284/e_gw1.19.193.1
MVSEAKGYSYNRIFGCESSQEDVFNTIGVPVVESSLKGINASIFAYGQTGAGKTHTMIGYDPVDEKLVGLIPRVLEYLFAKIADKENSSQESGVVEVACSFLEIYNETITDLLVEAPVNGGPTQPAHRGSWIAPLLRHLGNKKRKHEMCVGMERRKIGSHNLNKQSSRSHAVFTLTIKCSTQTTTTVSKLHLIDLAGSENQKCANTSGLRLAEGRSINKSLSALGNVIMALSNKNGHVPYRDSKLTYLLQDSLGGNSITTIIANVDPGFQSTQETFSTIQFANRVKKIKNK